MAEKLAKFTTMTKGTAEDYQIIAEASIRSVNLPDRMIEHLELLKGDHGVLRLIGTLTACKLQLGQCVMVEMKNTLFARSSMILGIL